MSPSNRHAARHPAKSSSTLANLLHGALSRGHIIALSVAASALALRPTAAQPASSSVVLETSLGSCGPFNQAVSSGSPTSNVAMNTVSQNGCTMSGTGLSYLSFVGARASASLVTGDWSSRERPAPRRVADLPHQHGVRARGHAGHHEAPRRVGEGIAPKRLDANGGVGQRCPAAVHDDTAERSRRGGLLRGGMCGGAECEQPESERGQE